MKNSALMLALLAAALAGCNMIAPYPTAPAAHEASAPADPGPRVAICYNTLQSTLDQVRAAAQDECSAGATATPVETDWYLQNCPLLLPARATFVCAPRK
jgi:hypothetical protein